MFSKENFSKVFTLTLISFFHLSIFSRFAFIANGLPMAPEAIIFCFSRSFCFSLRQISLTQPKVALFEILSFKLISPKDQPRLLKFRAFCFIFSEYTRGIFISL
ncbi:MAG: hypothetical protein A2166_06105 [Omnitrophica WOR_2 bacterium RBG_13_41_10]|nr:MAG: hypothetical protein A2166_06105 [Omnitrophica WOR_2 bacterium RBG_13_41_10]